MGQALADHDERFCAYLMDYATQQASELLNADLIPLLLEPQNNEDKDNTSAINETHLSQACKSSSSSAPWYTGLIPSVFVRVLPLRTVLVRSLLQVSSSNWSMCAALIVLH